MLHGAIVICLVNSFIILGKEIYLFFDIFLFIDIFSRQILKMGHFSEVNCKIIMFKLKEANNC